MEKPVVGLRALLLALLLAGCGASPLSLLTGGGPNVAANVQGGKTNTQTIGTTRISEQSLVRPQARQIEQSAGDTSVRAESVKTVVVNEMPAWMIVALVVAVLMDSPLRWPAQIREGFARKKPERYWPDYLSS